MSAEQEPADTTAAVDALALAQTFCREPRPCYQCRDSAMRQLANAPAVIAALTAAGHLTEERSRLHEPCGCRVPLGSLGSCCFGPTERATEQRRHVTPWEVAP